MKNLILLAISLALAFLGGEPLGRFYSSVFNIPVGFGSFIASSRIYNFFDGIIPAYIFSLVTVFTAFSNGKKYLWIAVLLIPAAIVEVYLDLEHIYFPIALGAAGWLIGLLLSRGWAILRGKSAE